MEEANRTRLSAAEGRRFALTVGLGFGVLALVAAWRAHSRLSMVMQGIAGIALLVGLLVPSSMGGVRSTWMKLGEAISRLTTPIFYTAVYLLVLTPTGWLRRTLGQSPVARTPGGSYWVRREQEADDARRRSMERQF